MEKHVRVKAKWEQVAEQIAAVLVGAIVVGMMLYAGCASIMTGG